MRRASESPRRKVTFGATRSARLWALAFIVVNLVLTLVVWRGFRSLG